MAEYARIKYTFAVKYAPVAQALARVQSVSLDKEKQAAELTGIVAQTDSAGSSADEVWREICCELKPEFFQFYPLPEQQFATLIVQFQGALSIGAAASCTAEVVLTQTPC